MGAYWKTLRVDTYFIKDGHLKKNLNVLGVDTYLINVRMGAYLITLKLDRCLYKNDIFIHK